MMAAFTRLHRELAAKRGKLNTDSFYQVEWEGKYALDGDIKKLMGQLPEKPGGHAAYAGVRY